MDNFPGCWPGKISVPSFNNYRRKRANVHGPRHTRAVAEHRPRIKSEQTRHRRSTRLPLAQRNSVGLAWRDISYIATVYDDETSDGDSDRHNHDENERVMSKEALEIIAQLR